MLLIIINKQTQLKIRLAANKRVRILELHQHSVKIHTIENDNSPGLVYIIPRIRFQFTLPFGNSYEITRTQFPLRYNFIRL